MADREQQIISSSTEAVRRGRAGSVGDGGWNRVRRRRRDAAMRAWRMARPGGGRRRRRRGRDELDDGGWRGQAGLSDGGEIEDEQNRRSIYIARDPLVPAGNTNRD